MKKYAVPYMSVLALCFILTGCQFSQSRFSQTVNNTGSAFAAAATTLQYAHTGKLTYAYASSSFEVYRSELSGIEQTLTASGKAGAQLIASARAAMQVVNAPCLQDSCNWRVQVATLNQASQTFLKAGNS